jgi:hypothetical protein
VRRPRGMKASTLTASTAIGSREQVATLVTLNPIVRVARGPPHHRETFRVRTATADAMRRRGVSGLRRNRGRVQNQTGAQSFHDASSNRQALVRAEARAGQHPAMGGSAQKSNRCEYRSCEVTFVCQMVEKCERIMIRLTGDPHRTATRSVQK